MQMFGQELGRHYDGCGEHGAQEETKDRNGNGGDDEIRDQPEKQLKPEAEREINADGESLANSGRQKPEGDAAQGDAEPEARRRHARREWLRTTHAYHKRHDPPADGNWGGSSAKRIGPAHAN